jgi:hypothetical protein
LIHNDLLKETKVIPPGVAQNSGSTEGRVQDVHLDGAPEPQCSDRGRGLHDEEIAMLVAGAYKKASGGYSPDEEGEVAEEREAQREVDVGQVDDEEEDGQGGRRAREDFTPDDVLAVLAVHEDVDGEVRHGHGQRVQDAVGHGPQRLLVVERALARRCVVRVDVPPRLAAVGDVQLALALLGELEQRLALGAGAVGVLQEQVDACLVHLLGRLERRTRGRRTAHCPSCDCAAFFAVASHGAICVARASKQAPRRWFGANGLVSSCEGRRARRREGKARTAERREGAHGGERKEGAHGGETPEEGAALRPHACVCGQSALEHRRSSSTTQAPAPSRGRSCASSAIEPLQTVWPA